MILTFTFKLIQLIVLIKKCKTISIFSFFNHYQYVFQYTCIKDNIHGSPISSPPLFLYWYVHYFNRPCNHLRTDIQYNPDLTPPLNWAECTLFYWPLSTFMGWHTGQFLPPPTYTDLCVNYFTGPCHHLGADIQGGPHFPCQTPIPRVLGEGLQVVICCTQRQHLNIQDVAL